jgi:DNA-binding PadR family transcriptional regulator
MMPSAAQGAVVNTSEVPQISTAPGQGDDIKNQYRKSIDYRALLAFDYSAILPGTIYPLLHSMQRRGWLRVESTIFEGREREVYAAPAKGRRALNLVRSRVRELYEEMFEEDT